ncbi:MAG TPA: Maf family nucleotide pyrophosphatase [Gammaproteobacteria bacterium]
MTRLILASTSKYRSELLARLGLPFRTCAPNVDERIEPDEGPGEAAARLARAKAEAVQAADAIVVGADQVPSLEGRILRKPGTHEAAVEQLLACGGRSVAFHTAVAVIERPGGRRWESVDVTEVLFDDLTRERVDRYLRRDRPYDCAGGFKAEGLGIALFKAIRTNDPTALIGLPLIWLAGALREAGLDPLGA